MVEFYREYYEEKGMLENSVYDGIPEVLEQLKKCGNPSGSCDIQAGEICKEDCRAF